VDRQYNDQDKKDKGTKIYQTLHRRVKIEQNKPQKKPGVT